MFGEELTNDIETDIDSIKNIEYELFVRYLAALYGKCDLSLDECYELYQWVDSKHVDKILYNELSDIFIKNTKKLHIWNIALFACPFIKFIMKNFAFMSSEILDKYMLIMYLIADSEYIDWNALQGESPDICVFTMEMYYTYFSIMQSEHYAAIINKLTCHSDEENSDLDENREENDTRIICCGENKFNKRNGYGSEIYCVDINDDKYRDIYEHYAILMKIGKYYKNIKKTTVLTDQHSRYVPNLQKFRAYLLNIE
jgi:hypothetical protein